MTAPGTLAIYAGAALAEILGCFAVWAWMRQGASPLWLLPGLVSLAVFAWLLTFAPADFAGRAYAAYGGVYIAASLVWLWLVEKQRPDAWDMTGAAICLHPSCAPGGLINNNTRSTVCALSKLSPHVMHVECRGLSDHFLRCFWLCPCSGPQSVRYRPDLQRRLRQLPTRAAKAIALRTRHAASPAK